MMDKSQLESFVTTLLLNGFHLKTIDRISKGNIFFTVSKLDIFGAEINYIILFNTDDNSETIVDLLISKAQSSKTTPLVVSDKIMAHPSCQIFSTKKFEDLIGGFIDTGLLLLPNLPSILKQLGFNKLPRGLTGKPDNLLEIYAKECLQYLLGGPAKRFGSDRLFESLPDGVVIGKEKVNVLFDGKAYAEGFEFKSDDILRFSKYVEEFNDRYKSYLGAMKYFLIVSGNFNDSISSISNRSDDLFNICGARLVCISSEELGHMVQLMKKNPNLRKAVLWQNILVKGTPNSSLLDKEIHRIKKDQIIK